MTHTAALRWLEVKASNPCVICGKGSWCSVSNDGVWAICRRVDNGAGTAKLDSSGAEYWVYRMHGQAPVDSVTLPDLPQKQVGHGSPADLDAVYRHLLGLLPLTQGHRADLRRRGLPDTEIDHRGYGSLSRGNRFKLADALVSKFGSKICGNVPGLYADIERGQRRWRLAGPVGILIPVRDSQRQIVALLVRLNDSDEGPKYVWLSSTRHGGPGPGSPVHVPLFKGDTRIVRVTEGALKGDVATSLGRVFTIGLPGVSSVRVTLPVLEVLGVSVIRLAFDADACQNRNVRESF